MVLNCLVLVDWIFANDVQMCFTLSVVYFKASKPLSLVARSLLQRETKGSATDGIVLPDLGRFANRAGALDVDG